MTVEVCQLLRHRFELHIHQGWCVGMKTGCNVEKAWKASCKR